MPPLLKMAVRRIGTYLLENASMDLRNIPRPAHHRPDGTFRNPPGSPTRGASPKQLWQFWKGMAQRRLERPDIPAGHRLSEREALNQFHSTVDDSVTWLGHASFLVRTGGLTILTDPYLSKIAGPAGFGPKRYVDCPISLKNLPQPDILVVSHNHYDHLDDTTLRRLKGNNRMTVIVPLGLAGFFRERGYKNVVELDWRQYIHLGAGDELGGVRITALPVVHWSRRIGHDYNATLWAGFSFKSKSRHIFFGGDSGYGDVFEHIGNHYGPFDEALLGIGAYEPRDMMRASHATPEEAVQMGLD